jgi:hypothetical protein
MSRHIISTRRKTLMPSHLLEAIRGCSAVHSAMNGCVDQEWDKKKVFCHLASWPFSLFGPGPPKGRSRKTRNKTENSFSHYPHLQDCIKFRARLKISQILLYTVYNEKGCCRPTAGKKAYKLLPAYATAG